MTRRISEAIAAAAAELGAAGVPGAARDARRLVAHAAGLSTDRLTLHLGDAFAGEVALAAAIAARRARQPVSHIVGERMFWGRLFEVTPDVLDPRPETEIILEQALTGPYSSVLDLGTGSGCLLVSLMAERSGAIGMGTDISAKALAVADRNARRHGRSACFRAADWFDGVEGAFDLIVSNPPYIAAAEMASLAPEVRDWEPTLALTDGADGLGAYRAIAAGAGEHLVPGGRLLLEHGVGQAPAVAGLLADAGLDDVTCHPDLDGRDRVVSAIRALGQ